MTSSSTVINKSSFTYHKNICSKLHQPYSKADLMGLSFPDWFSLYKFIKFVDINISSFFIKPYYKALYQQYEDFLNSEHYIKHIVKYHPSYKSNSDGYLFSFNPSSHRFVVYDLYEWNDIKEEADKFRPTIKLPNQTIDDSANTLSIPL